MGLTSDSMSEAKTFACFINYNEFEQRLAICMEDSDDEGSRDILNGSNQLNTQITIKER